MKRLTLSILLASSMLTALAGAASAQVAWNRKIQFLSAVPEGDQWRIRAVWTAAAEAHSVPYDLSTVAELRVNGVTRGAVPTQVLFHSGLASCESEPPCNGICGSAVLDGGEAALNCYLDGCVDDWCDCDCGAWITSEFPPEDLQPGDELAIILYPASGGLPEQDTGDDRLSRPFRGESLHWDRGIRQVVVVPNPDRPGAVDVQVEGAVEFKGIQPAKMNLDFDLVLLVNDREIRRLRVDEDVESVSDICFGYNCGDYCGTINNIDRSCDPLLFHGCACGASWFTFFPGLDNLGPTDQIAVLLEPAPTALPEVYPENDRFHAGTTASVEATPGTPAPGAPAPAEGLETALLLAQNAPNPFALGKSSAGTKISFRVERPGPVSLDLFDLGGRKIRALTGGSVGPGLHTTVWDGRSEAGNLVPAGVYFYRLTAGGRHHSRRMLIVE